MILLVLEWVLIVIDGTNLQDTSICI